MLRLDVDDEFRELERQARRRGGMRVGVLGLIVTLIGLAFYGYYRDYSPQASAVIDGRRITVTSGFDPRMLAFAFLAVGGLLVLAAVVMIVRARRR